MTKPMGYGLVAVLACALLLGCGGGGGEPTVTQTVHDDLQAELDAALAELRETEDERDAEEARLNAQLLSANNSIASLTTERDAAQAEVTRLTGELTTANDSVATLRTTLSDAVDQVTQLTADLSTARSEIADLTTEGNTARRRIAELETLIGDATNPTATSLRGQIAQLQSDLATAQGRVDGLESQLSTAEEERDRAQAAVETAQQQAQQAQQQAQAEADRRIAEAEAQANVEVRAPELRTVLAAVAAGDEAEATVSWPRGGSLQFNAGAYTSGSAAPSVPGSWSRRSSFTGQSGTTTENVTNETIFLYSNIQGPGGTRAIWKEHALGPVIMNDDLAMRARGSSARPDADSDTTTDGHQYTELTISGSLGGVSGTFTCSACDGTISADSTTGIDTHVTFPRGQPPAFATVASWEFSFPATSLNAAYQIDDDDAYLYFGIWVSEPVDVSGTPDFEYIAGGGAESGSALANFDELTGTATFTGGAVGKYATIGQVGQQNAKIGTFTATATFTANLGDDTTSGTLHGQLTDFREGSTSLSGWSLTLGATGDVGDPATITTAATSGIAVGSVGGVPVAGNWGADFYGMDNMELTNRVLYPVTRYPVADLAGVTGWFEADSTTAALAGAFGAACATGPCGR